MQTLLPYLKAELKITWTDEDTDLVRLLERGKAVINRLLGSDTIDYLTSECEERELLFDYVRYARNNAIEYWRENHRDQITSLSLQYSAEAFAALEVET
jgi:hypothetical protein